MGLASRSGVNEDNLPLSLRLECDSGSRRSIPSKRSSHRYSRPIEPATVSLTPLSCPSIRRSRRPKCHRQRASSQPPPHLISSTSLIPSSFPRVTSLPCSSSARQSLRRARRGPTGRAGRGVLRVSAVGSRSVYPLFPRPFQTPPALYLPLTLQFALEDAESHAC